MLAWAQISQTFILRISQQNYTQSISGNSQKLYIINGIFAMHTGQILQPHVSRMLAVLSGDASKKNQSLLFRWHIKFEKFIVLLEDEESRSSLCVVLSGVWVMSFIWMKNKDSCVYCNIGKEVV